MAKAIQLDTSYRMVKIITEQTKNKPQKEWKENERQVLRPKEQKDVEEMDVNMLTMEKQNTLIKQGACFKCQKRGQVAKDCPPNKERIPMVTETKSNMKDLVTQIQTMTEKDKMKFVKLMDDEEKADF